MKLVFFGTGPFALPILEALADHVSLVVTQPDRPSGRGMKLTASPVKHLAMARGLRVETPEKSRSPEFVAKLESESADALVVASYGQILSTKVLRSAVRGGINLHGSILPAYRGAAPIQRAIQSGEPETGVTLMQMDRGMDSGDIIAIERTRIGADETYGELLGRLAQIAAEMAKAWMPRIAEGNYERIPQDAQYATSAPKIEREETNLTLTLSAVSLYNAFRAFTPNPGATLETRFGPLKIDELRREPRTALPGTVITTTPQLVVAADGGAISLNVIQPKGKNRMTGKDWANGVRIKPGDSLLTSAPKP